MGTGNFVLGGLLSGLGKGMEKETLYDREMALENLRRQDKIDAETRAQQRDDASAQRDYDYDISKLDHAAGVKREDRKAEHDYDKDLAEFTSGLRKSERAADLALADKLAAQRASGEIHGTVTASDGSVKVVYKDGSTKDLGVKAKPTAENIKGKREQYNLNKSRFGRLPKLGEAVPGKPLKPGMTYNGQTYLGGDTKDPSNWFSAI